MTELILGVFIGLSIGLILLLREKKKSEQLKSALAEEKEKRIKIETEFNTLQKSYQVFDEMIKNSLKSEILDTIKDTVLKQTEEKIASNLENHSLNLKNVITPFEKTLEEYKRKVEEYFDTSSRRIAGLSELLVQMNKNNQLLFQQTQKLSEILHSPTHRGSWGEIQLKRIFELIGLKKGVAYEEQISGNGVRPDFIIHLPGQRKVIIDSKMPMSAYLNYYETREEKEKEKYASQHVNAINSHITALSKKQYWKEFEDSLDYVILYLPVEAAFALAISTDKELFFRALEKRIILASPSTLIPFLHMVQLMWKQEETYKNIRKIIKDITDLGSRYNKLIEYLEKLGQNLNKAVQAYNEFLGSWEKRFDPKIREINLFAESNDIKPLPGQIDASAKNIEK